LPARLWRQQRAQGIDLGLGEKARGVKGPSVKSLQEENRKLQRQKARLEEELQRAAWCWKQLIVNTRSDSCASRPHRFVYQRLSGSIRRRKWRKTRLVVQAQKKLRAHLTHKRFVCLRPMLWMDQNRMQPAKFSQSLQ
jgi:hypothetical protein